MRLSVHDLLGRELAVVAAGAWPAGTHVIPFDGRGLASGVYAWRLEAGEAVRAGRLTLLD